jgi:hypothetical protein
MNNVTLPTADTATHVKIIAVALAATVAAALIGIDAQTRSQGPERPLQMPAHAIAPAN